MSIRKEQCNKVCRILDDVLTNRPAERDSLIVTVRKAFEALELFGNTEQLPSAQPEPMPGKWISGSMYCRAWECSKCGYRVDLEDGGIYNFCAACGEKKG